MFGPAHLDEVGLFVDGHEADLPPCTHLPPHLAKQSPPQEPMLCASITDRSSTAQAPTGAHWATTHSASPYLLEVALQCRLCRLYCRLRRIKALVHALCEKHTALRIHVVLTPCSHSSLTRVPFMPVGRGRLYRNTTTQMAARHVERRRQGAKMISGAPGEARRGRPRRPPANLWRPPALLAVRPGRGSAPRGSPARAAARCPPPSPPLPSMVHRSIDRIRVVRHRCRSVQVGDDFGACVQHG